MTVLAIDQGTSSTKAVVVSDGGDVLGIAEEPVRPAYLAGGGVEQDPAQLLSSVLTAGRRAIAEAGQPVSRCRSPIRAKRCWCGIPDTGAPLSPALVWQDRRAEALCRSKTDARDWVATAHRPGTRPLLLRAEDAWLRRNATASGVVTTSDTWLVHHLTGEFVTDAATASRSLLTDLDTIAWDPQLLELFELSGERLPAIVANDAVVGATAAFGSVCHGRRADRGSAGRAAGATLLGPRNREMHFRHRGVPARQRRDQGSAAHQRPHVFAGLEPARRQLLLRRRAVLHRRLGDPLDPGPRSDRSAQRPRRRGRRRSRRHLLRPGVGRSGRALVAPGCHRVVHRDDAVHQPLPTGHRGPARTGRPDRGIGQRHRGRSQRAAEHPAGRRRADPVRRLMQATADLTQIPIEVYPSSHATALGAAALRAAGRRPRTSASPTRYPTGPRPPPTTRNGQPDRAADFRRPLAGRRHGHPAPR